MPAVLLKILTSLASLVGLAVNQTLQWVKQEVLRLARAARAAFVWSASFLASNVALVAACVLAFEAFAFALTDRFIIPLSEGVIARLIPAGSAGDGIVWILWDTGLNLRAAWETLILYVANYTALWKLFSIWLRSMNIALGTYQRAQKYADVVRQSSV